MNKTILAILIGALIISGSLYLTTLDEEIVIESNGDQIAEENEEKGDEDIETFVECLKEQKMVIYGNRTCPACAQLAESFGGYEKIDLIYVECTQEQDKCREEKLTGFVPEIQIDGELYEQRRDLVALGEATGCKF